MRTEEFRAWLKARTWDGKPITTVNLRVAKARRFEKAMTELDLGTADLDTAYDKDGMTTVMERLGDLTKQAQASGEAPAALVGSSRIVTQRMSSLMAAVRNYRDFRTNAETTAPPIQEHPILLFDAAGGNYIPVQQANQNGGGPTYRIKPAGASNRTEEAIHLDDVVEVARAILVDRRPARIAPIDGGTPNYLTFGAGKLVAYELAEDVAEALGLPLTGGAQQGAVPHHSTTLSRNTPVTTNLILYGPPGTGKTYATAAEAVRLCGEVVPEDRNALMTRYRELVDEERIAFVTFHQSMTYEDFVEGLRPSSANETGEPMPGGFRLMPEAGIFRRIAERAETLGAATSASGFELGTRTVFKMSLGEVANPADDYLYDEAMNGGYILLGDDSGMDWLNPGFATKEAMIEGYAAAHPEAERLSQLSGIIDFNYTMRSRIELDDLVVISKGNLLFRAIGVVTGELKHVERPKQDGYRWLRKVRWLWRDDQGRPYDLIYNKRFTQRTIYELARHELKPGAIESLISGFGHTDAPATRPYVLIIDEINRANISKVFGELITLLEPDKRLGMPNEIKLTLPYSKRSFGVPANLHIVGTMNTADRSIALLDTALRRRFTFKEVMPEPKLLGTVEGVNLATLLTKLNDRVEYLFDREHQIGHAYFIACDSRGALDGVMRHKVIPLLAEYFHEDWGKIAAVLGDAKGERFLRREVLERPGGFEEDYGGERYRWRVRGEFGPDAYAGLQ